MFNDVNGVIRFKREAAAAASLHHTNIVPVYEAGQENGTCYFAMQLIEGDSLDVIRDELRKSRSQAAVSTAAVAKAETIDEDSNVVVGGKALGSVSQTEIAPKIVAEGRKPSGFGASGFRAAPGGSRRSANKLSDARAAAKGQSNSSTKLDQPSPLVPRDPPKGRVTSQQAVIRTTNSILEHFQNRFAAFNRSGRAQALRFFGNKLHRTACAVPLKMQSNSETGFANHYHFVADMGRQAAGALHHAHERGIIHRDVKPSNLILDVDGIVWLADFGLAKQLDDGLTATQSAPGTLRYMSPERFGGQVDATADVYSLGASLYELLTLTPAFTSTDPMSMMNQIKNVDPSSPKSLDGSVPLDLQTIVMKSMAKEPLHRYATARAMQEDLSRFLDGQPISARSISTVERLSRWAKKRKGLAMALASLALLIMVTAVGSSIAAIYFQNLAGANLQLASEKAVETAEATKQRDEAYQNAYFADMRQAHQDLNNGQMRRMLSTLRDYLPTVPAKDVRGWEWYYLLSQAHQDAVTMTDFDGTVTQTEWSVDGKRIFTRGTDETLRIWKAGREPHSQDRYTWADTIRTQSGQFSDRSSQRRFGPADLRSGIRQTGANNSN